MTGSGLVRWKLGLSGTLFGQCRFWALVRVWLPVCRDHEALLLSGIGRV